MCRGEAKPQRFGRVHTPTSLQRHYYRYCHTTGVASSGFKCSTRNSPGDEIPDHDIGSYTPLAFNAPDRQVPKDDVCKILHDGQRMAKVQNGDETLPKVSTPSVGCTNVTDDRRICDSEDPNVT